LVFPPLPSKKKEIGIRKVVVAMDMWLQKFVFKISIIFDVFVITLIIAISVAFLCYTFQHSESSEKQSGQFVAK
jgi:hypothetical protein